MHLLAKIDNALETMEKVIVVALFAALILLIASNILARNLFGISFPETLELTPALVLWIALIGATLALKRSGTSSLKSCCATLVVRCAAQHGLSAVFSGPLLWPRCLLLL